MLSFFFGNLQPWIPDLFHEAPFPLLFGPNVTFPKPMTVSAGSVPIPVSLCKGKDDTHRSTVISLWNQGLINKIHEDFMLTFSGFIFKSYYMNLLLGNKEL